MIVSNYLYGPGVQWGVQRLPLNLGFIKYGHVSQSHCHAGELRAMQLVQQYTSIPSPRAIDHITTQDESYLVMSAKPGVVLSDTFKTLTDEDRVVFTRELQGYVEQLRAIPNTTMSGFAICNAGGAACFDHRFDGSEAGPFKDQHDFVDFLYQGLPAQQLRHQTGYRICFTHGDLAMRNILVKDGKISGIVDWETAGWYVVQCSLCCIAFVVADHMSRYPEWWEYTKCHFAIEWVESWRKIVEEILPGYQNELEAERELWKFVNPWG
jgi:aminoglycoside phosphotransferase